MTADMAGTVGAVRGGTRKQKLLRAGGVAAAAVAVAIVLLAISH